MPMSAEDNLKMKLISILLVLLKNFMCILRVRNRIKRGNSDKPMQYMLCTSICYMQLYHLSFINSNQLLSV